jgi:hypothetical protein
VSKNGDRQRRLLCHPWESLTESEQRDALSEARRCGGLGAGTAYWRSINTGGAPPPGPAGPEEYAALARLLEPPETGDRSREKARQYAADPRAWVFAEGWEERRRVLLELPLLSEARCERLKEARRARRELQAAIEEHATAREALKAAGPCVEIGAEVRLAVGYARVGLMEAEAAYERALLLYRAADPALREVEGRTKKERPPR